MNNYPYLYNRDFLKKLDKEDYKTQYTRILVLDFNTEEILATITGKATGGSCTFSGTSNMRRSANCNLLVTEKDIKDNNNNIVNVNNLISMNKKIQLETGFLNDTDEYSDYNILWFPLGTYVIKSANISKNNSGINISLTLNDKCSLLNGDMGGIFPAGVTLSEREDYIVAKDGSLSRVTEKLLIKDIIKYIVVDYGGEDPARVIVNDVPDTIVKVMKWIGDSPLYYYTSKEGGNYFLLNENLSGLDLNATYNYGQDVCYMNEPFVYPGKLECNMGETVAAVLDKIKNVLGNYEWFYDINGCFVFQEIKNYLNTSISMTLLNLSDSDYRTIPYYLTSVYTFDKAENKFLASISNNPQYQNIKNDFTVWGVSKTVAGVDKPIRYRLALDKKPAVNTTPRKAIVYKDYRDLYAIIPVTEKTCVENQLPINASSDKTKYYIYNNKVYRWIESEQSFYSDSNYEYCYLKAPEGDWRTHLYFEAIWADRQTFAQYPYAADLISEWPKIFNIKKNPSGSEVYTYTGEYYDVNNTSNYDYWLDILEGSPFSVESIGRRHKVVSEKDVNCLLPIEVPNFILIEADGDTKDETELAETKGQEVIQVSSKVFNHLTLGGSSSSAFDKIKKLLYNHTSYNESISLSTLPIYYLEPNTRITVNDIDTAISGDYMIKSISLPLIYNGMSTISATRIADRTF